MAGGRGRSEAGGRGGAGRGGAERRQAGPVGAAGRARLDMSAGGQAGAGVAGGDAASAGPPPRGAQLLSALFYGTCSFLLVLVNKALLTTYRFPSPVILGIGQMAATIMILYVSKLNKIIHFPDFDKKIPVKLFPLPLLYVGNHISGLSSTSKLRRLCLTQGREDLLLCFLLRVLAPLFRSLTHLEIVFYTWYELADVHRAQEIYHSTYFTPGNHHTRETVFREHHCQCLCHHSWCFHSRWF
uniref:Solute carrier family 35 member D2 n=1 Tax=Equus asinus TaxID=9793 RepID=A0A9L0I9M8_EQUAS